jgi:enoyl-CoA hydratase/carnithine racemase
VDLQSAFAEFDHSKQRVAILTGAGGRAFSAGAHVTDLPEPKGPSELAARFAADLSAVRNSENAAQGVRAFKERRRPQYREGATLGTPKPSRALSG